LGKFSRFKNNTKNKLRGKFGLDDFVMLLGTAGLFYGIWLIYPPAAFIVIGIWFIYLGVK